MSVGPPSEDPPQLATARSTRAVGVVLGVCAVVLVPWIVHLADTLPERQISRHYALAWAGFDVMLFLALGTTAVLVLRRSLLMGPAGTWSAALLVADAWFDVVTAPTRAQMLQAVGLAVVVELPLAALCLWVLVRAREIARLRFRVLVAARAGELARRRR